MNASPTLDAAGFGDATRPALASEPVLCGYGTPVNVAHKDTDEYGTPVPGAPHVVTVRTPEERLVWYRALPARTTVALRDLGVLGGHRGYLVRDDYAGWHQFDERAAGVRRPLDGYHLPALPILGLMRASTPEPEAGAQCVSSARWDLCGGPPARAVSTATVGVP
jgi:hypothetical protein